VKLFTLPSVEKTQINGIAAANFPRRQEAGRIEAAPAVFETDITGSPPLAADCCIG
jgi:hypothetical protein